VGVELDQRVGAGEVTAIVLKVRVKPNARASSLEQKPDGDWVARVKARPIDGKANDELTALVAERFRCHRSAVVIKSGESSRVKLLVVDLA
jgi:uncharacterized protein